MSNIIEITNFSAPELDVYARLSEAQLYHYNEPEHGLFIAESPKVVEQAPIHRTFCPYIWRSNFYLLTCE